jgi:hypothetical protein
VTAREIRLASRPNGWPTLDNFQTASVDLPAIGDGQVRVRNLFMSVDPYMRGRMNDAKSYVPPFPLGVALEGGAIGEVVESRDATFEPGAIVQSMRGWRDEFVAPAKELRAVDAAVQPRSAHLGVLGMPGMTAWVGLKLAEVKPGDRVFVSGAAGAVGSIAGQLAKLRGCFVVGSAGSHDKVKLLTEQFGFDAAINYKGLSPAKDGTAASALRHALAAAAPDGIDVYFDNVGGDTLEDALGAMRLRGRIVACGSISRYNATEALPGPGNLFLVVTKRLRMQGFLVFDHHDRFPAFLDEVAPRVADGTVRYRETIMDGIERAPEAFIGMLEGANLGKMLVRVGPGP